MIDQTTATSDKPAASRAKSGIMLPHVVRQNFLPEETVAALLDFADLHQADFVPSRVGRKKFDPTFRVSLRFRELGVFRQIIESKILAILPMLIDELRVTRFQVDRLGTELVAHGDGAFYKGQIDTATAPDRDANRSRALNAVRYFTPSPRRSAAEHCSFTASASGTGFVDIEPAIMRWYLSDSGGDRRQ